MALWPAEGELCFSVSCVTGSPAFSYARVVRERRHRTPCVPSHLSSTSRRDHVPSTPMTSTLAPPVALDMNGPAADVLRRIQALTDALSSGDIRASALVAALPRRVGDTAPEVQRALAALTLRVAHERPSLPEDLDDLRATTPALAPAWDWVELAVATTAPEERASETWAEWDDERVYRAVVERDVLELPRPESILGRVACASAPRLALLAISGCRAAVAGCALSPVQALALLEPLASHEHEAVRASLATTLSDPWLATTPAGRRASLAEAFMDDVPAVTLPALKVLAKKPHVLRPATARGGVVGAKAWALLGQSGDADDMNAAFEAARSASSPEEVPLRELLLAMHTRGVFVPPDRASDLVSDFLRDARWTAEELTRVAFTLRNELHEYLAARPVDDPAWRRLAELLAWLEVDAEGGSSVSLLEKLLGDACGDTASAALDVASRFPSPVAESLMLPHLDALPERALAAIRRHGGALSADDLLRRLDDPLAFGSARGEAIETLWSIANDRVELLAMLDPRELPTTRTMTPLPDPGALDRALNRLLPKATAAARLACAVEVATDAQAPVVAALFREAFNAEIVSPSRRRVSPTVPTLAEGHARRFGQRLRAMDRRLSRFPDDDDGAWLRDLAITWLGEAALEPDGRLQIALLELLRRVGLEPHHLRFVHRLWRAKDADVRRAAMETLIAADARGLTLSLCSLATVGDLRASRQAVRAIGEFGADWAEDLAIDALESPNMNLRKTAAEALESVGTQRCVEAVVDLLAQHDNPGLRASLLRVLDHVAAEAANGLLVSALEDAQGDRARMLMRAVDERLTAAQLVALLRARRSIGPALREATLAGALTLAGGIDALHAALGRLGRLEREAAETPTAETRLLREGWSDERALEIVAEGRPSAGVVRVRFGEWVRFATTLPAGSAEQRHTATALLRALGTAGDLARWVDVLPRLASMTTAQPDGDLALVALARVGSLPGVTMHQRQLAIQATRDLVAAEGGKRWETLMSLEAVPTRADLELCLATASDPQRLLRKVFPRVAPHAFEDLAGWSRAEQARALDEWLEAHPLGAPTMRRVPAPRQTRPLSDVRARLDDPDHELEAARALLRESPHAADHREVLDRYLKGLDVAPTRTLADQFETWPEVPDEQERALPLLAWVPPERYRAWLPGWIESWAEGDPIAAKALARASSADVWPALRRMGLLESSDAVRALPMSRRAASETELAMGRRLIEAYPHLAPASLPAAESDGDPLDELSPGELEDYARSHRGAEAARAIGRLGALGAEALPILLEMTEHADSQVRTVAFRWLKRVADRPTGLEVAHQMLRRETQRDLRRHLMRVLAHGRHEASYPLLIDLLFSKDAVTSRAAMDALERVGADAIPALRKAVARVRPDRRDRVQGVLDALREAEGG